MTSEYNCIELGRLTFVIHVLLDSLPFKLISTGFASSNLDIALYKPLDECD